LELAQTKDVECVKVLFFAGVSLAKNIEFIMKLIFSTPSLDDLIKLLKAWRFWSVGALIGGLLGAGFYYVSPPPYRAHAIVLVDFNLEQAWPQNTDREQFYYLERETRKMEEIAKSDAVLQAIVEKNPNIQMQDLKREHLLLSQPGDGGWNFYVDDTKPEQAAVIATAWANAFTDQIRTQAATDTDLTSFIQVNVTQIASRPFERSVSISLYIFVSAILFLLIGSIVILFLAKAQ
jgi:capsular polysaccharide biosynthesis protein